MSDPAAGAGLILRSILRQTGVSVAGNVETTALAVAGAEHVLAKVEGLPLQEQVGRMMRYSNNYIADVLTMGVALETHGTSPRVHWRKLRRCSATFVRSAAVKPASDSGDPPVMESGSGLTTANRLSAQDLVGVLRQQYPRQPPLSRRSTVRWSCRAMRPLTTCTAATPTGWTAWH